MTHTHTLRTLTLHTHTHTQNADSSGSANPSQSAMTLFPNTVTLLSTENWDFDIQFSGNKSQLPTGNLGAAHSSSSSRAREEESREENSAKMSGELPTSHFRESINRVHIPHHTEPTGGDSYSCPTVQYTPRPVRLWSPTQPPTVKVKAEAFGRPWVTGSQ